MDKQSNTQKLFIHINMFTYNKVLLSAQSQYCSQDCTQVHAHKESPSLTIDIQSSKLVNFIVDSNIREIGQVWVRTSGGRFLME